MNRPLYVRSFIGTHDQNWEDARLYKHDSVEVTVVLEGSGRFRLEDGEFAIEAGQIVLIPSNYPHSFHAVTPIRFGVLLVHDLPPGTRRLFDRIIDGSRPKVITFSRHAQDHYELLFREWLRVMSSRLKDPERNYVAWIEVLLLFVFEHSHSDKAALSMAHIAEYIRQNLRNAIPVSHLVEMAGLSEEGFRKRFLKVYGMTPKQYQQSCKHQEARWLLSTSEKDLQSIAALVGFSQLHSFSAWFKKLEGVSPSSWRNAQRKFHQ